MLPQLCVSALLAAFTGGADSFPFPRHPPALYHPPPPAPYHPPAPHYPDVPPKYDYTYTVNDDYRKLQFKKKESRDGDATTGSYSVLLPDGRTQIVTYIDTGHGLEAEVTYEGNIIVDPYPVYPHPPPTYPKHPYFPPTPIYSHPASSAPILAADPVTPSDFALLEDGDSDSSPVKIIEEPTEDETPVEDAEVEEADSSPAEEEEKTSPLEEEKETVVEIVENTTLSTEA